MKLDVLAFGAHPDDVELGAGATIAKWCAEGKKVGIIDLTKGELGTRGTSKDRHREATNAGDILGISIRENLDLGDGFFEINQSSLLQVIKCIRTYQPDLVLCNAKQDRHPDHARGSQLVSRACFLSGLPKIDTNQDKWRPSKVYHYIQWENLTPDIMVDVSGYEHKKMEAVLAYKTQFYDPNSKEPETPISSQNFIDSITNRLKDWGRLQGKDACEGFQVENTPLVNDLFDLV